MKISRRSFLKGTAAGAVSLTSMGVLTACSQNTASSAVSASQPEQDTAPSKVTSTASSEAGTDFQADEVMTADAAVIGAGISGMSAAIEMALGGLKVILVEKEARVGGTLLGTEGIYGGGSKFQMEQTGAPPMKYEVVNSELEFTGYRSDSLLWGDLFDAAGDDVDWLMETVGVTFERCDDYINQSKYPTFCWWTGENGGAASASFAAKLEEVGVTVLTGYAAQSLIVENKKIAGINIQEFEGEKKISIQAPAVLLATGGLANDVEYYGEKTGKDVSLYGSLFPIHETGDGMRMATAIGARETPIAQQNIFGVKGYYDQAPICIGATIQPSLYVNENGERFMAEDLCHNKFFALTTNAWESQRKVFTVMDSSYVEMLETKGCLMGVARTKKGDPLSGLKDQLEEAVQAEDAVTFVGSTLEELAENMGVDAKTFVEQVERYNAFCEKGLDEDFGKLPEFLAPVQKAPFYAVRPSVWLFATMGGIDVNRNMEVLDTTGMPIEGLYSSGLGSCNLYKETYNYAVSGGSNAYCCYSGRRAAKSILAKLA